MDEGLMGFPLDQIGLRYEMSFRWELGPGYYLDTRPGQLTKNQSGGDDTPVAVHLHLFGVSAEDGNEHFINQFAATVCEVSVVQLPGAHALESNARFGLEALPDRPQGTWTHKRDDADAATTRRSDQSSAGPRPHRQPPRVE